MQGIAYLASILIANVMVNTWHLVTIAGITFPAGAPMIGLTFTFRDLVQRRFGKWQCWVWMVAASLITVAFNPQLALASFAAFLVGEGVDWVIYTTCPGSFSKRVVMSNLFGLPLDSVVFVALAFGWVWPAIWGQTVVKLLFGLIPLVCMYLLSTQRPLPGMK